ncbi:MAG TPA: aromatic ring-hydroxylating dioxygenase subunit alpha [Burkholderiaceae bacterium]|jgi:nitrite reductase/ring-hydroxylating ferredoxin subunit|nr:aromatic ring-hydroxylating dioxygenase subunit alpha [Burkholderiaceae bacterium]
MTGSAYGRKPPSYDASITEVGPGTPCGEYLRRFWHPIGLSQDATTTPKPLRILGEDLILFRDRQGRPGLLYPRCAHRGTTLYYGRVEERGIRCCYHGWLFDVEGRCLEQPCEPDGGRNRDRVRQPWYPVQERYGLIWAYLGPPQKRPVLPRYECLEVLEPGEFLQADDTSIGSGGGAIVPCNWLQHFENVADPFHVPILHGSFSGTQFVPQMGIMPKVTFGYTERGVKIESTRDLDGGQVHYRITEAVLPTLRVVPNPGVERYGHVESIGWVLPIDDTTFRIYVVGRTRQAGHLVTRSRFNGKRWAELTEQEHQQFPGDWEAQVGQGPITLHSEENLVTSDQGVAMLRRMLRQQIDVVARGEDPAGVAFDDAHALVRFDAGNFLVDPPVGTDVGPASTEGSGSR